MSQSQLSQFSDQYSSSIFEDTPQDNLPFLPSDSVQSFPPNALYGETSDYTTDIVFSHPRSASPPEILERVGSLRRKNFALWTEMVNNEFVEWWLKTEFGSRINRNLFEDKRGARTAECWKHFHQVAAISDGEPRVMCKTCDHTLSHPADGHRGTSSMNKHYQGSVNCRKKTPQSKDIRRLIQNGVS